MGISLKTNWKTIRFSSRFLLVYSSSPGCSIKCKQKRWKFSKFSKPRVPCSSIWISRSCLSLSRDSSCSFIFLRIMAYDGSTAHAFSWRFDIATNTDFNLFSISNLCEASSDFFELNKSSSLSMNICLRTGCNCISLKNVSTLSSNSFLAINACKI